MRGDEVSCTSEPVCFCWGGKGGEESFALHLLGASTLYYLVSSSQQPEVEGKFADKDTKAQRG